MPSIADVAGRLFRYRAVRAAAGAAFLVKGTVLGAVDPYRRISDFCWVARVSRIPMLQRLAHRAILRFLARPATPGAESPLVEAFLASPASTTCRERWLPADGRLDPAFRDIMVLKAPGGGEKGVMLLKYSAKFDLFVSLFDLTRVMRDYYLVLEPCWAGYSDPSILMFMAQGHEVVIQCPEESDFEYITNLQSNLVPLRLGAADWVDAELFATEPVPQPKQYDVIMVANWAKHKNHHRLFAALPRSTTRPLTVLLLGFDWGGRTDADLRREMAQYDLSGVTVEIKKSLPAAEVAAHLHRSKVFVLLSEKEGANKAIVEAFFANVPAIVYEGFIGGARSKINPQTGILSSFEGLAEAIDRMCVEHAQYSPRAWALAHTGSRNATRQLNERLRAIALAKGEPWTRDIVEKVNAPNLAYKQPGAVPVHEQAKAIAPRYLRSAQAASEAAVPRMAESA